MSRRAQRALFVMITAVAVGAALAQDRLRPDPSPPPEEYYAKIRQVFAEVLRCDIVVQVLLVPSFEPEEIAGIRRKNKGFEAFASQPSSQIWLAFNKEKDAPSNYREIRVQTDARPISDALTERIRKVWQDMLLDAREPTENEDGLDGEDYHFSMPLGGKANLSASVWSPRDGKTLALVSLAAVLAEYAQGKADEATLIKSLEALERTKA